MCERQQIEIPLAITKDSITIDVTESFLLKCAGLHKISTW